VIYRQHLVLGAFLILIAEFMFASMGATVKALSLSGIPSELSVFMRNLFGLLLVFALVMRSGISSLKTDIFHLHLLRAMSGLGAMYCFFYALSNIELAEGMLLKMTAPLFMPLIAAVWLGENLHRLTIFAVGLGFIGVIIVLEPGGELNTVALIGLLGGALAAVAKTSLRRLGQSEPTLRVVFYFAALGTLVSAVPLAWVWTHPTNEQLLLMILLAVFGTSGQLLLTRGYAISPAGQMSPLTYTSVIFGGGYGYFLWGEIPAGAFIIGALLIAIAGILTIKKRTENTATA